MDLKGILSISGYAGLYKLVKQGRNGIIVESLIDQKRMPAYASAKISSLEDIAIFTIGEDMPLPEVLRAIYTAENGGAINISKSDSAQLKQYFSKILPNYDTERVYTSDMKRIISWYNLLQSKNLVDLEPATADSEPVNAEESNEAAQDHTAENNSSEEQS